MNTEEESPMISTDKNISSGVVLAINNGAFSSPALVSPSCTDVMVNDTITSGKVVS